MRLRQEVQAVPRPAHLSNASETLKGQTAIGPPVHVMVGVLVDDRGRVLIAQRRADTHMAGAWEFPGGKREAGETRLAALQRELKEELGIEVIAAEPLIDIEHEYADRNVRLDVWHVLRYANQVTPVECQPLRWVSASNLEQVPLLPADLPIVSALKMKLADQQSAT
jgi:8-oxo-dGTP diphosphatase